MVEANGEPPNPEDQPGEEQGGTALEVEEARKRIHAALDACEDPLHKDADGHQIIERLHLRPSAKA
eukprot:6061240-Amphidinium_carterae.1